MCIRDRCSSINFRREGSGSSGIDGGNFVIVGRAIVQAAVCVVIGADTGDGCAGRTDARAVIPVDSVTACTTDGSPI